VKGKKLLAGLISAAMVMGTMILPAFADDETVELDVGEGRTYSTFEEARDAVDENANSITYVIYGKVVMPEGEVRDVVGRAKKAQTVTFKAADDDTAAEIALESTSNNMMGRLEPSIDVNYENLKLSRANGKYVYDLGEMNHYFTTSSHEKTVTYTGCSFPNGTCNNQYGKTVYNNCNFTASNGGYGLWIYAYNLNGNPTGQVEVTGGTVEGNRGVKTYSMGQDNEADITVTGTKFKVVNEGKSKPAIMLSQTGKITLNDIDTTECTTAVIAAEVADGGARTNKSLAEVTINGEKKTYVAAANSKFYTTVEDAKTDGATEENIKSVAAKIDNVYYTSLEDAVKAAKSGDTVALVSDLKESIEIPADKCITLDLNGKTLTNEDGKNTIDNKGTLTVIDSSENKSGVVDNISHARGALVNAENATAVLNGGKFMRSAEKGKFTDDNSGKTESGGNSWYTIANNGTIEINEGVTVENNGVFSSNIVNGYYGNTIGSANPKLTINGGTFKGGVKNVKNDSCGILTINAGDFTNDYFPCIMNWNKAEINGGTFTSPNSGSVFNGFYDSDTAVGELKISDGTFNGGIINSVEYPGGNIAISGGSYSTDVSAYCAKGLIAVSENGKFVVKPSKATVIDTATSAATTITLNDLEKNLKSDSAIDFDGTEHAVIQVVVSAPSSEDKAAAPAKEKESNTVEMYDIKVVKTANGVSEEVPATNQSVTIGLGRKIADGAEPIVKHIKNGVLETISPVTVSDDRMSITFTAPSFSTYYVEFPAVAPTDIAENINISLENEVIDGMEATYDLVISGENDKAINRFMSSEWKFESTGAVEYEIIPTANVNETFDAANDTYELNMDGKTYSDATGRKIKLATVKITGSGNYTFGVKSAKLHAAEAADSIVTSFDSASAEIVGKAILPAAAQGTLEAKKYELSVNIAFNNAIEDNAAAYQNMQVSISGGDVNETIKLGSDVNALSGNSYTVTCELPENIAYTVTVSGAGYRTARYTVTMTGDKVLNFWNNAKDTDAVVEEGNAASARKVTFLAGDIVRDNSINIYDLSAVVSYFGTKVNKDTQAEYAKYDLNRDGVIDSKDVAYVLVSWGK